VRTLAIAGFGVALALGVAAFALRPPHAPSRTLAPLAATAARASMVVPMHTPPSAALEARKPL